MSVEPPAKLVVIGAGPIGLEAALYARYLGYQVEVLEAGGVCESVMQWGHVRMFTPFSMNSSQLGLAALKAQDPEYQPPEPDALLTGREWAERYLLPLAQSDLLIDCIRTEIQVQSIRRSKYLKYDLPGDPRRGEDTFSLEYLDCGPINRGESVSIADVVRSTTAKVVLDCSGTFGQPNDAALHAMTSSTALIEPAVITHVPDCQGEHRLLLAGRHSVVIGNGYSAATSVVNLAALAEEVPGTQVTWLTRYAAPEGGPIARIEADRLPERDVLAARANQLATASDSAIEWIAAAQLVSVEETDDDRLRLIYRQSLPQEVDLEADEELIDDNEEEAYSEHELVVDSLVVNAGYRPSIEIFQELQVHLCYATEGPMKLAAALQQQAGSSSDCLDQTSCGAATLATTEPNFFLLGAKSYGRNSNFLYTLGLDQIREAFTLIGGRESLNLYDSVKNLV